VSLQTSDRLIPSSLKVGYAFKVRFFLKRADNSCVPCRRGLVNELAAMELPGNLTSTFSPAIIALQPSPSPIPLFKQTCSEKPQCQPQQCTSLQLPYHPILLRLFYRPATIADDSRLPIRFLSKNGASSTSPAISHQWHCLTAGLAVNITSLC
jgi:hypothetical protein